MTWTPPLTAIAGAVLTAAQWNASLRDNLNMTAPALASVAGQIFVSDGVNSVQARTILAANVNTTQTTASGPYADLATVGPVVTATTGTQAIVFFAVNSANSGANNNLVHYAVSGASTIAADDTQAMETIGAAGTAGTGQFFGICLCTGLTPGSNVFTLKYRTTGGTATFANRRITVIPL